MAKEITMPKLSDTMEEGKVLRWLKQEGDAVERGEVIAEIETDKADMEMEAFDSGTLLAIQVKAGESAAVGEVIGYLGQPGERVEARAGTGRASGAADVEPSGRGAEAAEPSPARGERGAPVAAVAPAAGGRDRAESVRAGAAGRPGKAASAVREGGRRGAGEPPGGVTKERRGTRTDGNASLPGPHADIAGLVEPEGFDEEEEGEEGSSRQAPEGEAESRRPASRTKGLHDRLPFRTERPERAGGRKVSPVARRLAHEAGLDLASLEGSGPDGRIVRRDVERALESRGAPARVREAAAAPAPTVAPRAAPRPPGRELPVPVDRGEAGQTVPHSRLRRAIATRMAESKRTVPHFYTTVAVRMDGALELKEALALRDPEARVGVSHLIVKAAALALERFPRVGAVYEEDRVRIPEAVDIALAVAVEDGLLAPVLRDCARKPLQALAREARELVGRVRAGKLAQDDLQGASFTVSNLGVFEIEQFAAIVTPPQSAILAAGSVAEEPIVRGGRVVAGSVLRLTLSADHRVIDGALAAAFLVELKRFLENPLSLVL